MELPAGREAFDNTPDCAVFAETIGSPPSVCQQIGLLRKNLGFPRQIVGNKCSLHNNVKAPTNRTSSHSCMDIIDYIKCRHGESNGIITLQRATDHEVRPNRPNDTLLEYLVRGTVACYEGSH